MRKNRKIVPLPQKNLLCAFLSMINSDPTYETEYVKMIHHRLETLGMLVSLVRLSKQEVNRNTIVVELDSFIRSTKPSTRCDLSSYVKQAEQLKIAYLDDSYANTHFV